MGRELRMVPPYWNHPKELNKSTGVTHYQPMLKTSFNKAVKEWKDGYEKWEKGLRPQGFLEENIWVAKDEWDDKDIWGEDCEWWEYHGSPPSERSMYTPFESDEATWYQLYETVSEGTPVTPPFATKDELITYLVNHGDFWDQKRGDGGWNRQSAENVVNGGYAPSMVVTKNHDGSVEIKTPKGI